MIGIYSIYCMPTGRRYIGSSINIRKKCKDHRHRLRRNMHGNPLLQEEWNTYGPEGFVFSDIEYCNEDSILILEKKWIEFYKSNEPGSGYNILDPVTNKVSGLNPKRKGERNNPGIPVVVIDIKTGLITKYKTIGEASRNIGISPMKAKECVDYWEGKKNKRRQYQGYIVIKESIYDSSVDYINKFKPRLKRGKYKKKPHIL